jgi:NADH-quinone oxidoreductase subunit M
MVGVFVAQDLFLFYIFWEFTLVPMYFLIGIWGGPRKIYAAIKFFLYTMAGSILMLLAILWLGINQGTFSVTELIARGGIDPAIQRWLFAAFAAAFAIKVPVWPLHSWLPDAHVEAPTAGSVILAGVLLKLGTYGFVRFNLFMFPQAAMEFAPAMAVLAVIGILYGAIVSYAQSDAKKLVAYSSVSHMGFCLLGMASFTEPGINGAVLQMFTHGIITGMLFLIVGVIYDRAHHRDIDGFGGLGVQMPIYAGITSLAFFASLGLPGLAGFWAEALVFIGAFNVYRWITIASTAGIVLGAAYLLWTLQRVFLGPLNEKYRTLPEINARELFTLVPLGAIVIVVGIYPKWVIDLFQVSMAGILSYLPVGQ